VGSVSLGAPYARILGFQAANWASSAKAAEGTDTAQRVQIVDADNNIVYLDAADADYGATSGATPSVNGRYIAITGDETATGLTWLNLDRTGAALSSQGGQDGVIAKSPVVVSVVNGGTATDYFEASLYVEV
jgi:hypothetical protein